MEGFSTPGFVVPAIPCNANGEDGSSGSEMDDLAQAMSTVHIRRRGRSQTDMHCTPQSAMRARKRIVEVEGLGNSDDDKENETEAVPALDKYTSPPKATPSRLDRITQLREELTCSVCLDVCTRPCTTPCGHSFCRRCLRESMAHSSKCAKCREVLPAGFQPMVNTALWNTIQLLFPSEAAAAPPATPPEPPLAPSNRQNINRGFRLNSGSQGIRPGNTTGADRPPVLTNPFRPVWQQRQQVQVRNRTLQLEQAAAMAAQRSQSSDARVEAGGGGGMSRLAELLDRVGSEEDRPQGSSVHREQQQQPQQSWQQWQQGRQRAGAHQAGAAALAAGVSSSEVEPDGSGAGGVRVQSGFVASTDGVTVESGPEGQEGGSSQSDLHADAGASTSSADDLPHLTSFNPFARSLHFSQPQLRCPAVHGALPTGSTAASARGSTAQVQQQGAAPHLPGAAMSWQHAPQPSAAAAAAAAAGLDQAQALLAELAGPLLASQRLQSPPSPPHSVNPASFLFAPNARSMQAVASVASSGPPMAQEHQRSRRAVRDGSEDSVDPTSEGGGTRPGVSRGGHRDAGTGAALLSGSTSTAPLGSSGNPIEIVSSEDEQQQVAPAAPGLPAHQGQPGILHPRAQQQQQQAVYMQGLHGNVPGSGLAGRRATAPSAASQRAFGQTCKVVPGMRRPSSSSGSSSSSSSATAARSALAGSTSLAGSSGAQHLPGLRRLPRPSSQDLSAQRPAL